MAAALDSKGKMWYTLIVQQGGACPPYRGAGKVADERGQVPSLGR